MIVYYVIGTIILITIIVVIIFLLKKKSKKNCSNKCTSCTGNNDCGESCSKLLCGPNQVCFENNCCIPHCPIPCQTDSCGGTCPCTDPKQICKNGICCDTDPCDGTFCGTNDCGDTCVCNDNYCLNTCCKGNQCVYEDICNIQDKTFLSYLQDNWGKFCQPSSIPNIPSCQGCKLISPKFVESNNNLSAFPISGTIQCDQCEVGSGKPWNKNVPKVNIDPDVQYYYNNNGFIIAGPKSNPCKDNDCTCLNDADCIRWGKTECIGEICK